MTPVTTACPTEGEKYKKCVKNEEKKVYCIINSTWYMIRSTSTTQNEKTYSARKNAGRTIFRNRMQSTQPNKP